MNCTLPSPPLSLVDPHGDPLIGTYAGPLERVDLGSVGDLRRKGAPWRATHLKRWVYVALVTEQHVVAVAIVHLNYAATAFVVAVERATRSMVYDRSFFTVRSLARINDRWEEGCEAHFRAPRARLSLVRLAGSSSYTLAVEARPLSLRATLATAQAPLPIVAVAPVPDGVVNVTQKRVLLPSRGTLLVGERSERFEDAVGGIDFTHGYLARRTAWHWAFAMGKTDDGQPVAFNLVDDFNGGRECAVWLDGGLFLTQSAHFDFRRARPLGTWQISTPDRRAKLRFTGDALHAEKLHLGVIRSDFVQPIGTFRGTITPPEGPTVNLDAVPGVVEMQDVRW